MISIHQISNCFIPHPLFNWHSVIFSRYSFFVD